MRRITTIICGLLLLNCTVFSQHSTYYIGHSGFGWDLIVGEMVNDLATDAGIITYDYGFQFIGGTCISYQWENHNTPQGGTDSHLELPTGNYDILVMAEQIPISEVIYTSPWGCNLRSVAAVDSFYDMAVGANPNTRVYLMEFHNEVDGTSPTPYADWAALNASNRPLWEQVVDSVTLINSGPSVCIVPVAAAFQALADSVIAGAFPGISNWMDIFDPNDTIVATIHPTEVTYYLVACVHYATIFGESPVGLTNQTFAAAGWPFDTPTTAQALMMQEIAWEIVSNDTYACMPTSTGIDNREPLNSSVEARQGNDQLILSFDQEEFNSIRIFNVLGGEVHSSSLSGNSFVFTTDGIAKGVYFYQLYGSQIAAEKFIVR